MEVKASLDSKKAVPLNLFCCFILVIFWAHFHMPMCPWPYVRFTLKVDKFTNQGMMIWETNLSLNINIVSSFKLIYYNCDANWKTKNAILGIEKRLTEEFLWSYDYRNSAMICDLNLESGAIFKRRTRKSIGFVDWITKSATSVQRSKKWNRKWTGKTTTWL